MATFDLRTFARRGAEARIAELNAEVADIYRVFPDLRGGRGAGEVVTNPEEQSSSRAPAAKDPSLVDTPRRGRRRKMTAAERKAVSQRMKTYWAERMKGKK